MKELEKGLEMAVTGSQAQDILNRFQAQLEAWDATMPPTKKMIWDFGLGAFEKIGLIECWIANEEEAGYCGKYLFVFDGQTCPMHSHKTKHETFFIAKGRVSMTCDGKTFEMKEGDVLPVPPGKKHTFTGIGSSLLLELSTPCKIEDNCFEDPQIPIGK